MKIRCLLTCIVSLVIVFPLQAQVGKEMKAFRNKEGITVTMLTPSLYKLYKQSDMSIAAEEALNNMKEINVMYVDKKRATPKVVEEINQRLIPIMENESKYTLVRSHQGVYGQERLYVTQNNEQITALVLWNEEKEQLSVIELKGNIDLDNVDEIAAALNVKGLDRLAYINTPAEGSSFAERMSNPMEPLKFCPNSTICSRRIGMFPVILGWQTVLYLVGMPTLPRPPRCFMARYFSTNPVTPP